MTRARHIRVHAALVTCVWVCFSCALQAQENACFSSRLKTLQVKVDGKWDSPPVMLAGQGHHVEICFDDLQAKYQRYTYTLTHCNSDWQPSELHTGEYMTGFNELRIEDYEPAIGTEMNYCHYRFVLPNENTQLLVSGNYRVDIYEDDEEDPVAQACFSILEPRVGVDIDVTANTDIDTYARHQQVSFSVNYNGYPTNNPLTEFKYTVLQNRRWDNHAENLRPTLMQVNKLIFNHNSALIFPSGNEYRRFEIMDEYVPTMHVDRMEFDGSLYHAILMLDERRTHYLYDEDQDGRFYVRDSEGDNDYFITHFTLQMPQQPEGDVYLFGDLTTGRIDDAYKMGYNPIDHQYELAIPLKQGSYNYMYLFKRQDEMVGLTEPCEGDFHMTENEYSVYVYHRPFGERYDRLVGFRTISTRQLQ